MGLHAGLYTHHLSSREGNRAAVRRHQPDPDQVGRLLEYDEPTPKVSQTRENLMHKEEGSRTAFAFVAGAPVGAGVMLLFAPQAGSEFRSSVRDYTRKAKDEWDHASEQGQSALDTALQHGKEWIQGAIQNQAPGGSQSDTAEADIGSAPTGSNTGGDIKRDT